MKKTVQIIFLIFLLTLPLDSIAKTYTLALAGIAKNSKPHRIAINVAKALSKRLGHTITTLPLPAKRAFSLLKDGVIDGDLSRVIDFAQSMPELIRVTEPIGELPYFAYVKSVHFTVDGWESLVPYSVVYNRGYKLIETNLKPIHNDIFPVDSTESALLFLAHDRADVFVQMSLAASPLLKLDKFKNLGIKALHPPVTVVKSYTFFAAKHEAFAKKFGEVLKDMKNDGTLADILSNTP